MDTNAVVFAGLVVALVAITTLAEYGRSGDVLERWAAREGLQILSRERRLLARGPFFFRTTRSQQVFRVTVRGRDGSVRHGYVRVGGFLLGVLSERADVVWD